MQFKLVLSALAVALAMPAFAQTTPATAAPAAAPAAAAPAAGAAPTPAGAPSWKQGMEATKQPATLHPFAPVMTGTEAKDLPLSKLKLPPGFKIEVFADGVPTARSMALGDKGTILSLIHI